MSLQERSPLILVPAPLNHAPNLVIQYVCPMKDPGLDYLGERKIDIVKLFHKITQFDLIREISH